MPRAPSLPGSASISSIRAGRPISRVPCSRNGPAPVPTPAAGVVRAARAVVGGVGTDGAGTPVCSSYLWATPRDRAAMSGFALQDGEMERPPLASGGVDGRGEHPSGRGGEETGYAPGLVGQQARRRLPGREGTCRSTPTGRRADGQRLYVVPSAGLVVVRLGFSPRSRPKTRARWAWSATSSPPPEFERLTVCAPSQLS